MLSEAVNAPNLHAASHKKEEGTTLLTGYQTRENRQPTTPGAVQNFWQRGYRGKTFYA